ncbi:hypothetical protein F5Y15DRAFT_43543 [Xylariaceae sp. FL0016]|nr:hypothetical protein F5Y15DRAFT_43543 [Xylariaceae sp. FL0016]
MVARRCVCWVKWCGMTLVAPLLGTQRHSYGSACLPTYSESRGITSFSRLKFGMIITAVQCVHRHAPASARLSHYRTLV